MKYADQSDNLRIELDTKHCELTRSEVEKMETDLRALGEVVRDFPVSDLYITVEFYEQTSTYDVKVAIILPKRTLFAADRDDNWHPAYEQCVRRLVKNVEAYKSRMSNDAEISKHGKGTRQPVQPTQVIDHAAVEHAVSEGDYNAFYTALLPLEESVRKRVGRWVQRYPDLDAQIGDRLQLADLVEDVFLTAFEQYDHRSRHALPGDWIESLIDPALRSVMRDPDGELANVEMARTARGG